jgi:hypothetical protein
MYEEKMRRANKMYSQLTSCLNEICDKEEVRNGDN